MKQILIQLDADTAERLERVAPARSRKRSEFIRNAIRRALWEREEERTRQAYLEQPDVAEPGWPEAPWEPWDEVGGAAGGRSGRRVRGRGRT